MKTIIKSIVLVVIASFYSINISAQEKQSKTDTVKFEVKVYVICAKIVLKMLP